VFDMTLKQSIGKSAGFFAEDEEIARLKVGSHVGAFGLFRGKPAASEGVCGEKFPQGIPSLQGNGMPVIEAGAPQVLVLQGESEFADQVQDRPGCST